MSAKLGAGHVPGDRGPTVQRVLGLLDPPLAAPDVSRGYVDLLGETAPEPTGIAGWAMRSPALAAVYQRWWRPAMSRLIMGMTGPGMAGEYRLARAWLALSPGDTLLDVACGPGNFTRELAADVGDTGLTIGADASEAMLSRAVRDTPAHQANIVYLRADATDLPLRAASVDAVCCFAALHLMRQPSRVLDKITTLLRPGGRVALMTSCRRDLGGAIGGVLDAAGGAASRLMGMRMFGRDELTRALAERGFTAIKQRVEGVIQFVGGELPLAPLTGRSAVDHH